MRVDEVLGRKIEADISNRLHWRCIKRLQRGSKREKIIDECRLLSKPEDVSRRWKEYL